MLSSGAGYSQTANDQMLASQYLQEGQYEKAAMLYEKLFKQTSSHYYYSTYLKCLIALKDYNKAEKIIKQQIKSNTEILSYNVDLGSVYKLQLEETKAKKEYEKAIDLLKPSVNQITDLYSAFYFKNEIEYAISTLKRGRKLLNNDFIFAFDIAQLFSQKKDIDNMIIEYLKIAHFQYDLKDTVQNALQVNLKSKSDYEQLRIHLLKNIQKYADKVVYSELLIWHFVQLQDFESALIQVKALDKRFREEGQRLLELSDICAYNGYFEVAIKAVQYVIDKGVQCPNYLNARKAVLEIKKYKITRSLTVNKEELLILDNDFKIFVEEFGKNPKTAETIREWAQLKVFYLYNNSDAIKLLEELLSVPQLFVKFKALCKLDLGDIYVIEGDMWESTLYYSQVDKAFKDEPIGHEARLRNAKLSFYKGEFQWAQAQLDIIKSATSDLISNDAIQLSMLISDNLALDTNTNALQMYANASLFIFQNKVDAAMLTLDSITKFFPGHSLSDDVLFSKSKLFKKMGDIDKTIKMLTSIIENYSYDILADDAIFELADIYHYLQIDTEKAMKLYQDIIIKYPGSLYVVEARKRYRQLRGDDVN